MSNIGLRKHLKEYGIGVDVSKVGDRYVLSPLGDSVLGGSSQGTWYSWTARLLVMVYYRRCNFMKRILTPGKKLSELKVEY